MTISNNSDPQDEIIRWGGSPCNKTKPPQDVTGRLASSDPNLQNIPVRTLEGRRIREAFVAPQAAIDAARKNDRNGRIIG